MRSRTAKIFTATVFALVAVSVTVGGALADTTLPSAPPSSPPSSSEPGIRDPFYRQRDVSVDDAADSVDEPMPYQLSREQIDAALRAVREGVRSCFRQHLRTPRQVPVQLVIEPMGRVSRVATDGDLGTERAIRCVERTVATADFPHFTGPRMKVSHPFLYR